jgi:hypothetical protein
MLIVSLVSVVPKLLAIKLFFTKQKLQNKSGMHAAVWQQKLAADLLYLTEKCSQKILLKIKY